jgi:hypothetical protein
MKLTSHLRLVLGLRMCGAIPPLPVHLHDVLSQAQDVFIAWYLVKHRDNLSLPLFFLLELYVY